VIFASPEFPFVLAPFLGIYWSMKKWVQTQKILLLLGGYGFYSLISWQFSLILFLYTFFIGLLTQATQASYNTWKGKFTSVVLVIFSIGLLAYFKYYKFAADEALQILQYLGLKWEISVFDVLLPIGISFYIFQAISYALDIKSRKRV
jgi:D-alanyl-lipoteichoic acid acyltransferase DltB (MBOAT superfamily)